MRGTSFIVNIHANTHFKIFNCHTQSYLRKSTYLHIRKTHVLPILLMEAICSTDISTTLKFENLKNSFVSQEEDVDVRDSATHSYWMDGGAM